MNSFKGRLTEIPDFENLKVESNIAIEIGVYGQGRIFEKHKNIKRALDTIENEKIWILKIQEENTKGMKGPCKPGPHNNF